jgi:hypothetical protein
MGGPLLHSTLALESRCHIIVLCTLLKIVLDIRSPLRRTHRIGSQVLISRFDPLKEHPQEGTVVSTSECQLKVSFPRQFNVNEEMWR